MFVICVISFALGVLIGVEFVESIRVLIDKITTPIQNGIIVSKISKKDVDEEKIDKSEKGEESKLSSL
jgi:large-conductance mechanosensitive channel